MQNNTGIKSSLRHMGFQLLMGLKWIFESFIRIVGPFFVLLATVLICGVIYVHFVNSIPFYAPYTSISSIMHIIMSVYISIGITYNYLSAVFTPAGLPPTVEELGLSPIEIERIKNDEGVPEKGHAFTKFCKRCNRSKPERTHHCHVCGKCVMKMDHHCPWIANCVGHRNHHFFVLFLFWLWIGCGYAAALGFIPFTTTNNMYTPFKGAVPRGAVVFSFVIALAVCIALSLMLTWQIYLVLTSQTTIEFYFNRTAASAASREGRKFRNPFDLGISGNFQYFFGTRESRFWFSWLLPMGVKPGGDGITYPRYKTELPI